MPAMASVSFHAASDVSTMYPADAVFYVVTIVALLTAQQMFDAYLPLLSMAHWRSLAVGRGEEDPGGGKYPLTACFMKKEDAKNKIAKKKIWEDVQPGLETNATCAAAWRGNALVSSAGAVTCASVSGGKIS